MAAYFFTTRSLNVTFGFKPVSVRQQLMPIWYSYICPSWQRGISSVAQGSEEPGTFQQYNESCF